MKQINLQSQVGDEGQLVSPTLPEGIRNYLIDIDGTITDDVPNEESERMKMVLPYPDARQILNDWAKEGHIITFFTSRTEEHRQITETWLEYHGFIYHDLLMCKPRGGNYHIIDDRVVKATQFVGKWSNLTQKQKTIEVFED